MYPGLVAKLNDVIEKNNGYLALGKVIKYFQDRHTQFIFVTKMLFLDDYNRSGA